MDIVDILVQTLPNFAFAALGYVMGWRIYQDSQRRIDFLISVIVGLCSEATAEEVREKLRGGN